mmetsp:Transcript_32286/g.53365  ORF Transcript_32286/g.53365 Transcript_32286/m.53365 type:complete len:220 (+) Transcript_32286:48-707(+)
MDEDAFGIDLVDTVGWLAAFLFITAPFMPDKRTLSFCSLCTSVAYSAHFALLGAWGGTLNQIIGATNALLGYLGSYPKLHSRLWLAIIPVCMWTCANGWDVLPYISMFVWLVAFQCKEPSLQLLCAVGSLPWCPYALHIGSSSTLASCLLYSCLQVTQACRIIQEQQHRQRQKDSEEESLCPLSHVQIRCRCTARYWPCRRHSTCQCTWCSASKMPIAL